MGKKRIRNQHVCHWLFACVMLVGVWSAIMRPAAVGAYDGSGGMSMTTGKDMYITLVEDTEYRWNANGSALSGNVIHLDNIEGDNCRYKLTDAGDGFYAIKHNKSSGTDYFVDVDGNNNKENQVLHLWSDNDYDQNNRQFSFHDAGKDSSGRQMYYIQVKGSGQWIGLQYNNKPADKVKVAQVSETNRKAWYVSQEEIPPNLKGGESRLYDDGADTSHAIFSMSKYGESRRNVNVNNDAAVVDGNRLHLYYIGTSSKVEARYDEVYDAYVLRSLNLDNNVLNYVTDFVWDVDGADKEEGSVLHIWHRKGDHPSQLWRFVKTDDGEHTYKVYNVNSGLWVSVENENDADNVKLVQSEDATVWELAFMNKDTDAEAERWMADLADDMPLSEINIPATHDAGAANIVMDAQPQQSAGRAQQLYIDEQLRAGVRALDIRATTHDNDAYDPIIVHGGYDTQCQRQGDEKLRLSNVMDYCRSFLVAHPTETIIVTIDGNDRGILSGSDTNVANAVDKYLNDASYPIWKGDTVPTLGDVRGKIVLHRRYSLKGTSSELPDSDFGMDLSGWEDNDYSKSPHYFVLDSAHRVDDNGLVSDVYVQDHYKAGSANEKLNIFGDVADAALRQSLTYRIEPSEKTEYRGFVYNYTTTADSLSSGRDTNDRILDEDFTRNEGDDTGYFYSNAGEKKALGIVWMNYIDVNLTREVYRTNSLQKSSEYLVCFPESVTMTQGQTLSEMNLSGALAKLPGTFTVDDVYRVLNEVGTTEVPVTFVPESDDYASAFGAVAINVVPATKNNEQDQNTEGTSAADNAGKKQNASAATGDERTPYLHAGLLLLSLGGIVFAMGKRAGR